MSLGGDAVGLVCGLGLLGGLVLAIEVLERLQEAAGDTMLVVKVERTLGSLVADNVAVGEVFGNDTGTGLLLLGNFVAILPAMGLIEFLSTLGASY